MREELFLSVAEVKEIDIVLTVDATIMFLRSVVLTSLLSETPRRS